MTRCFRHSQAFDACFAILIFSRSELYFIVRGHQPRKSYRWWLTPGYYIHTPFPHLLISNSIAITSRLDHIRPSTLYKRLHNPNMADHPETIALRRRPLHDRFPQRGRMASRPTGVSTFRLYLWDLLLLGRVPVLYESDMEMIWMRYADLGERLCSGGLVMQRW